MKTRLLLLFAFVLGSMTMAYAQTSAEQTNVKKVQIFDYDKTPDYCFYKHTNPLLKFDAAQLDVLEAYGYPKFERHGDHALEQDIMIWQEAKQRWEEQNAPRQGEILAALGISR